MVIRISKDTPPGLIFSRITEGLEASLTRPVELNSWRISALVRCSFVLLHSLGFGNDEVGIVTLASFGSFMKKKKSNFV